MTGLCLLSSYFEPDWCTTTRKAANVSFIHRYISFVTATLYKTETVIFSYILFIFYSKKRIFFNVFQELESPQMVLHLAVLRCLPIPSQKTPPWLLLLRLLHYLLYLMVLMLYLLLCRFPLLLLCHQLQALLYPIHNFHHRLRVPLQMNMIWLWFVLLFLHFLNLPNSLLLV